MPSNREAEAYVLLDACNAKCSLNVVNLGEERGQLVHQWIEAGLSFRKIVDAARTAGFTITDGSVGRHFNNHMMPAGQVETREDFGDLSEIEALSQAIKEGQKNIPSWRMTPGEWMKAMELKLKLTQGTVFDGMLSAMAAAGLDDGTDADGTDNSEDLEETSEQPDPVRQILSQ